MAAPIVQQPNQLCLQKTSTNLIPARARQQSWQSGCCSSTAPHARLDIGPSTEDRRCSKVQTASRAV
ncbi:hypothetical protein PsYK624_098680 [Phanerochaete sordida]|uniref:Uncharacterized protein n=1 Tax=Phanerochaete sordida TaxID=48140 RepID=A0A9P3GF71_9APHY|nr:hypothetical protein PsYK624_098680 [Phanerochaete sordida]